MERSSPSRSAGVAMRKVSLAGETFLLSQVDKVRKAADEEALVISRRLDMLAALSQACAKLPQKEKAEWRSAALRELMTGIASHEEWRAYYGSLWRLAFRLWNALNDKHRGSKTLLEGVEWCYEVINGTEVPKDELDALDYTLTFVSQEQEVGNSSGSTDQATQPMDARTLADGQQSMTSLEGAV